MRRLEKGSDARSLRKGVDWIRGWRRVGRCNWALLVSLVGCAAATVGMSVLYSFKTDFQPQGRYCLPALLPVAVLTAKGVERIAQGVASRKIWCAIVFKSCLLLGLASMESYFFFLSRLPPGKA